MRVRITAFINGDGYAFYPGQVIVGYDEAAEWVRQGKAVSLDVERAILPSTPDATLPAADITELPGAESRRRGRK